MKHYFNYLVAGLALATLSGCTAHYRKGLREFQRGPESSFYQRTLEWTRTAETAPTSPTQTRPVGSVGSIRSEGSNLPEGAIALVLGVDEARLVEARARLETPEALDRVLGAGVRWNDLALAVALHNPEVQAARQDWQATLCQYEQADYLEGLVGQFRAFTRNLNVETGEPLNKQMSQAFFPYPSVIAQKGEMVRQMARMAELDWQKMLRDNIIMAGEKYFEYQYLARAQATAGENVRLLDEFEKSLEERYRTGLIPQSNLLRAQNDLARQRNTLADLQAQTRSSRAQLNALVGRPAEAPLGPAEAGDLPLPSLTFEGLNEMAQAGRQEILIQEAAIGRTQAAVRMSEVMNRPPASQGYSVFERGMMPESAPEGAAMGADAAAMPSAGAAYTGGAASAGGMSSAPGTSTKFTSPIEPTPSNAPAGEPTFGMKPRGGAPSYGFAQAEAYLAETRARLVADRQRLENIRLQTQSLARSALDDLDVARRKVELLSQVTLPRDETTYNISLSDYRTGNTTFVELIDAERELIDARLMVHDARKDLNMAILKLAGVAGRLVR